MQRLKMQQSADSADTSASSSETSTRSFKAIWKKAVSKLTPRRSRSTDDSKFSSASPNTNAGIYFIGWSKINGATLHFSEYLESY